MPPAPLWLGIVHIICCLDAGPNSQLAFYFPTLRCAEALTRGTSAKHVDEYMATVHDQLMATLWEDQAQSMAETQQQKQYYDWKTGAMELKPGDLVLVKADAFKGKRKIKGRWEDEACEVVCQITTNVPTYEVMDQCRWSCILHWSWLFLITSETGIPLCVGVHQAWDWCTSPTPVKPTPKGNESENTQQVDSDMVMITQCQAARLPRGGSLGSYDFFCGYPLEHPQMMGWKLQVTCRGSGCLQDCMHLAEGVDICSPLMPLDSGLNDCHNYSQNWVMVARP